MYAPRPPLTHAAGTVQRPRDWSLPVRREHGLAGARLSGNCSQGLFLPSRALAFCFKGEIAPARVGKVPARACSEALGGRMGLGEAFGEECALPEREPLPETESPFIAVLITEAAGGRPAAGEAVCEPGPRVLCASPSRHMRLVRLRVRVRVRVKVRVKVRVRVRVRVRVSAESTSPCLRGSSAAGR